MLPTTPVETLRATSNFFLISNCSQRRSTLCPHNTQLILFYALFAVETLRATSKLLFFIHSQRRSTLRLYTLRQRTNKLETLPSITNIHAPKRRRRGIPQAGV